MTRSALTKLFSLIVAFFSVTILAQGIECSCDAYTGRHIWDTQRCCNKHHLGASADVRHWGKDAFKHTCVASPEWKSAWARTPVSRKQTYLNTDQYRSIRNDPEAQARVPAPDKVQCDLECLENEGPGQYPTDYGEEMSLFKNRNYFMEHDRHIKNNVGYCYKPPTAEQFAKQQAWFKANEDLDDPHFSHRAHEQHTATEPHTGFIDVGPSRFYCVEASWNDFV